jgi:hypothetical protein
MIPELLVCCALGPQRDSPALRRRFGRIPRLVQSIVLPLPANLAWRGLTRFGVCPWARMDHDANKPLLLEERKEQQGEGDAARASGASASVYFWDVRYDKVQRPAAS